MTALVEVHSLEKIKKQYSAFSLFFMCVCLMKPLNFSILWQQSRSK